MNRDDLSTYLRRVSERVVEGVLAHPDRIRKVLFPSSTETVIDDEVLITVSGLGYIDYELVPSARLSELGAPIGDVDLGGGGPARAFTSADVRKLATQLTLHPVTGLAQALSNTPLPPQAPPPSPAALIHLRASDRDGAIYIGATLAATGAGAWLSLQSSVLLWIAGQIVLAAAFVEWFVLLHECGHATLFRTRAFNTIGGHLAGALLQDR